MENIKNFIIGNIVALTSLLVGVYGVIYKSGSNTARQEQEVKMIHERVDRAKTKLEKNIDKTNELAERLSRLEGRVN